MAIHADGLVVSNHVSLTTGQRGYRTIRIGTEIRTVMGVGYDARENRVPYVTVGGVMRNGLRVCHGMCHGVCHRVCRRVCHGFGNDFQSFHGFSPISDSCKALKTCEIKH